MRGILRKFIDPYFTPSYLERLATRLNNFLAILWKADETSEKPF
jgi:hypothetical protein